MNSLFPIYTLDEARSSILQRVPLDQFEVTESLLRGIEQRFGERLSPQEAVRRVIADVRADGDEALRLWSERIDGVVLNEFAVSSDEIQSAVIGTPEDVLAALDLAVKRIHDFHQKQPISSWIDATEEGALGQLLRPIDRVGVYVPGGTAPLPSSLLMSAIPAQVAGVKEIVVCTPPGPEGEIPLVILAAAAA